ncbi:MAG TPA: ribonuclease D [Rickettsiales bacterium]|nr:ribonuclease D [Rickettsiales bacterium]
MTKNEEIKVKFNFYEGDLPDNLDLGSEVSIDTEAMGLNNNRDRLCLVQVVGKDGMGHLIRFQPNQYKNAKNLKKLLTDSKILKIMHFARFDMAILQKYLGVRVKNVYCTKIASKIARTYTDAHGLKALVKELLGVNLNKQEQTSYWGAEEISKEQMEYAVGDVLFLHEIKDKLEKQLEREGRTKLAHSCFKFLNTRVDLDLAGWLENDIFSHE